MKKLFNLFLVLIFAGSLAHAGSFSGAVDPTARQAAAAAQSTANTALVNYNPASVAITGGNISGVSSGGVTNLNVTGTYTVNGSRLMGSGTPAISSGFGTSPFIAASNGSAVFNINVGTGGTASSGVVSFGVAANNGWNCVSATLLLGAANMITQQTATTTTTVTFNNYTMSTGAAIAWPASSILRVICMAY